MEGGEKPRDGGRGLEDWEEVEGEGPRCGILTSISPKDEVHTWSKLHVEPFMAHEVD